MPSCPARRISSRTRHSKDDYYPSLLRTFTQTLQKLGWRERDNDQFDVRWSEGDVERTRAHAMELEHVRR